MCPVDDLCLLCDQRASEQNLQTPVARNAQAKTAVLKDDANKAHRTPRCKTNSASAGNRTRVTSMATMYSTTRPLMLMLFRCLVSDVCGGQQMRNILRPKAQGRAKTQRCNTISQHETKNTATQQRSQFCLLRCLNALPTKREITAMGT